MNEKMRIDPVRVRAANEAATAIGLAFQPADWAALQVGVVRDSAFETAGAALAQIREDHARKEYFTGGAYSSAEAASESRTLAAASHKLQIAETLVKLLIKDIPGAEASALIGELQKARAALGD